MALAFAAESLRKDPDIVHAAVERDGTMLTHAGPGLNADKHLVLAAVKQNGCALKCANHALRCAQ